jgi:para-aminobenzoate synthetase component I
MVKPADITVCLESGDSAAAWNFAGKADQCLWADGRGGATLADDEKIQRRWDDPLAALKWMAESSAERGGRWIGFISYDLGRWFERLPERAVDDLGLPLFAFSFHRECNAQHSTLKAQQLSGRNISSNFTRDEYLAAIKRVIEYIRAGDVFQVNLAQRFTVDCADKPSEIYRRLPAAAYGAFLDYGNFALLCNSPELFVRVTPDRRIITRPIKGTRLFSDGMDKELRDSIKDQAELNMIVDLERNDLGRICEVGSVRVRENRAIEAHPTVYHGVATIEGRLHRDVGFVDLLRGMFPGGSVTGAPKIRAMQIIDELEPARRGPYCGAIGYLAADGTMEFNVAIRTMIARRGRVHIPVGGGIVADSDPAQEYEETLVKARAMFAALGVQMDEGV